jgi:hypothetical protein
MKWDERERQEVVKKREKEVGIVGSGRGWYSRVSWV